VREPPPARSATVAVTPSSSWLKEVSSVENRTWAPSSSALARSRTSSLSWSMGANPHGLASPAPSSSPSSSVGRYSGLASVSALAVTHR
jgi:hypothetical protein